jgi:hypothetical protein
MAAKAGVEASRGRLLFSFDKREGLEHTIGMRFLPASLIFGFSVAAAFAADPTPLSLSDFTDYNGAPPAGGWSAEEGSVIHLKGKGGSLISKLEYSDFELEWDWKLAPKANNGVKYWVTKVGGKEWLGIEYQMIDDLTHADGLRGGSHSSAAFYDIKEPAQDKGLKPVGEWNSSRVVARDGVLQHWLNGKLVGELDSKAGEWKERIAASKFKNKEDFAPGKGRIMLTDHGDETWFRNIRIKSGK